MVTINNAAVGMETRRRIRKLVTDGELDEPCARLIERVLDKSRPRSVGGWVFSLACGLGALPGTALEVGSAAELFHCAIDFIDDMQDGDSVAYLFDVPPPIQINVGVHLLAVYSIAASDLSQRFGSNPDHLLGETFRLLSQMLCGQRLDLTREAWSTRAYERATRWMSQQFKLYFRLAALAARTQSSQLEAIAEPLGILLQISCDLASADTRLTSLPQAEISELRDLASQQVSDGVANLPSAVRSSVEALLASARGYEKAGDGNDKNPTHR